MFRATSTAVGISCRSNTQEQRCQVVHPSVRSLVPARRYHHGGYKLGRLKHHLCGIRDIDQGLRRKRRCSKDNQGELYIGQCLRGRRWKSVQCLALGNNQWQEETKCELNQRWQNWQILASRWILWMPPPWPIREQSWLRKRPACTLVLGMLLRYYDAESPGDGKLQLHLLWGGAFHRRCLVPF